MSGMESSKISSKLGEGIDKIVPTHSGSSSRDSIKIADAGLQSDMKQRDALPSKTMAQNGQVNVDKRMELTRVATELYNVEVGDPVLDPTSLEFDVYKWRKWSYALQTKQVLQCQALSPRGQGNALPLHRVLSWSTRAVGETAGQITACEVSGT
ncbi:hypothetical protein DL98DRAFT_540092 [Cadophora sp. DSE1049]|nr:hypothetical protein DL98DRAFT_540092 [Cadophora sp. DSE1049]